MPKFCPNCGNQMSDNAKFCLECGARLEDYSSGCAEIKDNVIQRSQVGAASVGKVEISPTINATATAAGGYVCRICGAPATTKCRHCKTYICGRCLKKAYYVQQEDHWGLFKGGKYIKPKTIKQIISQNPSFFCKECFDTRVDCNVISVGVQGGYFSENELLDGICANCKSFLAHYRCERCGKMFCAECDKNNDYRVQNHVCPFCKNDIKYDLDRKYDSDLIWKEIWKS